MSQKFGLGRGLESLFNENSSKTANSTELRISEIEPNKNQPRKVFDEASLLELSENIKAHGLLQPIVVRPTKNLTYQIVAGERRWRASRLAGLETVPVVIREMTDDECMEMALIENLQREDLNPVEEALGYKQLMQARSLTQEQVADIVNKSRPAVANALRLLKLPQSILELVSNGEISSGHARAMLALEGDLLDLAVIMSKKGCSVREIERLSKTKKPTEKISVPNYYKEVSLSLSKALGKKVKVTKGAKKSTIEIEFYSEKELTEIANLLGNER